MALDRARVQQLAANPGTRAALPTSVLQRFGLQKYVQARALNQRLNQPVIPGGSMTQRDLAQAADAAVKVQYGPQQQLYQRQAQMAPQYFNNYAQTLRDAAGAQQAQAQQAGQSIQALYASGPHAPGSQQANVGAAQAGTSSLLGEAESNYLNRLAASAQSQGLAQRNMALQKGAQLAGQMGAANIQERSALAQRELQNVATAALANVHGATATAALESAGAAQTRARAYAKRQATAGQPSTIAKPPSNYPGSQADWNNMSMGARQNFLNAHSTGKGAGSGKDQFGNTPQQIRSANSSYAKVLRIAKVIGGNDPQTILLGLTQKFPTMDDAILHGAAQVAALGKIGPNTKQALRELGVQVVLPGTPSGPTPLRRPGTAKGPPGTTGTRPT